MRIGSGGEIYTQKWNPWHSVMGWISGSMMRKISRKISKILADIFNASEFRWPDNELGERWARDIS